MWYLLLEDGWYPLQEEVVHKHSTVTLQTNC